MPARPRRERPGAPRFLLAPDAFKGTMTAAEVAGALAEGLRSAGGPADLCPVADGGEGTIAALAPMLGGEERSAACRDPLGRPIEVRWLWLSRSRCAILEMARVSGLALLDEAELDAEAASSAGTGELLLAAARAGALGAVLAVGGTASSDGGRGALEAIAAGGGLGAMELVLACDVRTPFERAAELFGPQKGASPAGVRRLTARLHDLALQLPRDPRGIPMTGAGGGIAGALWAVHDAALRGGAQLVLEAVCLDRRLALADAVVVGEGRLDEQSRQGKVAGEIFRRACERGVPVHAVVGGVAPGMLDGPWRGLASLQLAGTPEQLREAGARLAGL